MVTKKKGTEASPPKQKSRAKYHCPTGLGRAIFTIRLLSPEIKLRSSADVFDDNPLPPRPEWSEEEKHSKLLERNKKVFLECIKDFSGDHRHIFFALCFPERSKNTSPLKELFKQNSAVFDAIEFYEVFREQRTYLKTIARFFAQLRAGDNLFESDRKIVTKYNENLELPVLPAPLSRAGKIGKIDSEIINDLTDLVLDRIRECEICSHIFWAKRDNAKTCSPRCLSVLHTRNSRALTDEQKAEKKAQRAENNAYKQKLEENRSKK